MKKFSSWVRWDERSKLEDNLNHPGIYTIFYTDAGKNLAGKKFNWEEDIVYIGETKRTLKIRLDDFNTTIKTKRSEHTGADKFRTSVKNIKYSNLFVAVRPFKRERADKISSQELKLRGKIVNFEYLCLAEFWDLYDRLPRFNQVKSKKST
jgi:hypothetical protein